MSSHDSLGVGRVAATVVAVCVVGLVSGCTLLAPPTPSTTTPAAIAPDADPIAQQLPNLLVAGQTIGTGTLRVVDHEPISKPVAEHPLTGTVRIVVRPDRGIEVRIRPDQPADPSLAGIDLVLTGKRHDGGPENIQIQDQRIFPLNSGANSAESDGELVLPLETDAASLGDPTFLHSIEESPSGDARVMAAAVITWTITPAFPELKAVDRGSVKNAGGRVITDNGTLAYYVPKPDDTIYAVARRFGLTETQLVWLNPELANTSAPQLRSGVGVNLDPARR
ncbi:LysM peptidoglycan-binding domain-containing protein [Leifsonia poae]|uniref:LysM peptidoglycan-binding domain-containing protein n=1 Tax=Leifsonia poae TaxID=110933 RepID=UPI003D677AB4